MIRRSLIASSALLGLASAAFAHHGWGSYDAAKVLTVTAPVEALQWQNPHVHINVRHDGATWEAVLAPPFRMDARGLSTDLIKPGTTVTVVGYASPRSEREMRAERITVAGKTFELR